MPLITGIIAVFSVLTVAVTFPDSFINQLICGAIDLISIVFPSTPDNLKLSALINNLASFMPIFGKKLIENILGTARDLLSIYFLIKIYKLIPFKMS